MEEKYNVLLVCSGNTCRSAMGEIMADYVGQNTGLDDLLFDSAGYEVDPAHKMFAPKHDPEHYYWQNETRKMILGILKYENIPDVVSNELMNEVYDMMAQGGISSEAATVLESFGIPKSFSMRHKSKQLEEKLINGADLILTMTEKHRDFVSKLFPGSNSYTLLGYSTGKDEDISDPWGKDLGAYKKTATEIASGLIIAIPKIIQASKCKNM